LTAIDTPGLQHQFATTRFPHQFRRCQQLALEVFQETQASERRQIHLVLPPGSGKTLLGLEIARRIGRPTLVLCPNTAIQSQWERQWRGFQPAVVRSSCEAAELAPLTILTYQAVSVLDNETDELDTRSLALWQSALQDSEGLPPEEAAAQIERMRTAGSPLYRTELARYRQKTRQLVAEGGERRELLGLLHPNGRRLIEEMKEWGNWTLVMDECHHLLDLWGYLLRAFVEELGPDTFKVGLTATPPRDLDAREQVLYRDLFDRTDFELPAPAAVKDGSLAPYQDLVYLTTPLPAELEYIEEQQSRFLQLLSRVLDADFGSVPFVHWVQQRILERPARKGTVADWGLFERDRPSLALASLRFLHRYKLALPEGAHIQERHRQDLTADDWVALLEDYCLRQLKPSGDPRDVAAWQEIRAALPSVGYVLTTQGIRNYVSTVDRVLALSAGKAAATLGILETEKRSLGGQLRALVLCDYERAGRELVAKLRGVLDPQAGSAALLLRTLLADPGIASLEPILLTGRTVACSRSTAYSLMEWLEKQVPELVGVMETNALSAGGDGEAAWGDLLTIQASHPWWRPRNYVRLVTEYFEHGHCQCLVGTRGLLGEGWDAKRVNVLIDLTAAATSTAVHQSRGRSLRLDPDLPSKVANNWDVVCVAPGHPKGFSDYTRFVRKHRHYYALTEDGEIESGVSHVHPSLSPYGPPSASKTATINQTMLARPLQRQEMYDKWEVGEPYRNQEIETLRVRMGRPWELPTRSLESKKASRQQLPGESSAGCLSLLWAILGAGAAGCALVLAESTTLALMVAMAFLIPWLVWTQRSPLVRGDSTGGIESIARAVVQALHATDAVSAGEGEVRVAVQSDGYYRCYLEGASTEESRLFTTTLEEVLSPLETPRCIMPRVVLLRSGGIRRWIDAIDLRLRGLQSSSKAAGISYHNVPSFFSVNGTRMKMFERAWHHHVSPGRPLYSHGHLAQEILSTYRGQNPMEVSTQIRTLWR